MSELNLPIGYGRQSIDDDDRQAVLAVLNSDFLTQGPAVDAFEQALAKRLDVKHVIAVTNGTAALHLACLASGLQAGDLAVTSTLTFLATANGPLYCGAQTHLLDIDPKHGGMSETDLRAFLKKHPDCKVVLPIHFAGLSGDMKMVREISGHRMIIEDACHALGGTYENGRPIGSCCYSDMTVFSFHPVKPITTGEGGVVTTNDDALAKVLKMLRNHGIEREQEHFIKTPTADIGPWSYEQQILGFNYRMSDLQAALGESQLKKLDDFRLRRQKIAGIYDAYFKDIAHIAPYQCLPNQREHSGLHIYVLLIDFDAIGMSRGEVMLALREKGIGTQVHYIPVHRQPYHIDQGNFEKEAFPIAEDHYSRFLTIPLFPTMSDLEAQYVCDQIVNITTT